MKTERAAKPRGRPRCFHAGEALDAAMTVFWREGYEGASLSDLTKAMGINRPSLYSAFGDKESLFRKVLEHYGEGPGAYVGEALTQPTALAVVKALLDGVVNRATDPANPRGCLLLRAGLTCGQGALQTELVRQSDATAKALRQRLERGKREGDLTSDANPAVLARYVTTVVQGLGIQASSGASRDELREVVQIVLRAWPK